MNLSPDFSSYLLQCRGIGAKSLVAMEFIVEFLSEDKAVSDIDFVQWVEYVKREWRRIKSNDDLAELYRKKYKLSVSRRTAIKQMIGKTCSLMLRLDADWMRQGLEKTKRSK